MTDSSPRSNRAALLAAVVCLCSAWPAAAQINIDAYRDYFLVGQFGEVCTMCEMAVLCEAGETPPEHITVPEQGSFTLYHLETRTFWSQIATIWEWFITNFRADSLAARGHTRPARVFVITDGQWSGAELIEARLILDPGVVELSGANIDRVNRQWLDAGSSTPIGYCQRLPLWDSLAVIDLRGGAAE